MQFSKFCLGACKRLSMDDEKRVYLIKKTLDKKRLQIKIWELAAASLWISRMQCLVVRMFLVSAAFPSYAKRLQQAAAHSKLYRAELWRADITRQMWTDCAACACLCCSEQCHNSLYFICSSWMLSSLFSRTIWGRIVLTEFDNSCVNTEWFSYGSGVYPAWTQRNCKGYWN